MGRGRLNCAAGSDGDHPGILNELAKRLGGDTYEKLYSHYATCVSIAG